LIQFQITATKLKS